MAKENSFYKTLSDQLAGRKASLNVDDMRANPEVYSLFSKLRTTNAHDTYDGQGDLQNTMPDLEYMLAVASEKGNDITDNETIMSLLPDLERAAQIMISYIRSPNFLLQTELQYKAPVSMFPQSVGSIVISHVQEYFQNRFRLDGKIHGILYDIMMTKGARVYVVIPEASLDEIINGTGVKNESNSKVGNNTPDRGYGIGYNATLSRQSFSEIDASLKNPKSVSLGILGDPCYSESKTKKTVTSTLTLQSVDGLAVGFDEDVVPVKRPVVKEVAEWEPNIKVEKPITYELPDDVLAIFKAKNTDADSHKDSPQYINFDEKTLTFDVSGSESMIDITEDFSLIASAYERRNKITENLSDALSLQSANDFLRRKASGMTGVQGSDRDIMGALFKKIEGSFNASNGKDTRMLQVSDNEQTFRENLSEPLIIDWPTESVIPVYKAGRPEEHVYYILLLDEEGQPIDRMRPALYFRELMNLTSYNDGKSMASSLIKQGKQMFQGFDQKWSEARQIDMLNRVHNNAVIKDILNRTRNGLYGKNLEVGEVTEAFRIMFYRSLKGQRTRMLMMPKSLVTYMAFDYDFRGMGVSLLDKMKILLSLRIQFMLAQVRVGIENSIPRTTSTIHIDERDPDPKKTIQTAKTLILQSSATPAMQTGLTNIGQIEDVIFNSGKRIAIETDHPGIPRIGHDVEHSNSSIPMPEQETSDMLTKMSIMGIGLPHDMVDNSLDVEFAASVMQSNFITNLMAYQKQSRFNPYLKEFVTNVTKGSPKLLKHIEEEIEANLDTIIEAINENIEDDIDVSKLDDNQRKDLIKYLGLKFIDDMDVTLPTPNDDNLEMKNQALSDYEARIDNAIRYLLSDEAWPSEIYGEDTVAQINTYGKIVKADLVREWMIENDYMGGLMKYLERLDNETQSFEKNHNIRDTAKKAIIAAMEMANESKPIQKSAEAVIKVNDLKGGDADFSGGGDYSSGDTGGGEGDSDDGGEGGGGGDDMGFDMNFDFGTPD